MKNRKRIVITLCMFFAFILLLIPIGVYANEFGSGEYHARIQFRNTVATNISNVKVNGNPWTSSDDVFYNTEDVFTLTMTLSKVGEKFPDISLCGGECRTHYELTKLPSETEDLFDFTLVITDANTEFFDFELVEGPPIENNECIIYDIKETKHY